jgi:hypothetical protein
MLFHHKRLGFGISGRLLIECGTVCGHAKLPKQESARRRLLNNDLSLYNSTVPRYPSQWPRVALNRDVNRDVCQN